MAGEKKRSSSGAAAAGARPAAAATTTMALPREGPYERQLEATTAEQRCSLAHDPISSPSKHRKFDAVELEERGAYFLLSCRPITKVAEDDMEEVSAQLTDGERQLHDNWAAGEYDCARCARVVYRSSEKWKGPCVWPSFRMASAPDATSTAVVTGYNEYPALGVEVREVYCGGCDLFLGHQFDDGVAKGDTGPGAGWRH